MKAVDSFFVNIYNKSGNSFHFILIIFTSLHIVFRDY